MSETETCPERVWRGGDYSGGFEACGKPVKRDGLCGTHANARDREIARKAAHDKQMTEASAARELAQQFVALGYDAWGDSNGVHLELPAAVRLHSDLTGTETP